MDLICVIDCVILSPTKDRWICDLNGDGLFRVKDIRSSIDSILLSSDAISTRWVKYVPIKINVFVWRARLDRLPTRVNLDRRGVIIDSVLCPLCGAVSEDISHVLFRCDLASRIFRRICRWWELDSQDLSSFADWDVWFSSIRRPSKSKVLLEGVFFVAWCTYPEGSLCQPRIDASMGQNPTDSHLEGKPPRKDSNMRPLVCGNNLPKDTLSGQLS
ncbi:RNA-directed DNA polymerase, eukaryota [Tanacetum coccineum]